MTKAVNQYGFSPIAVEWDIWLCPRRPGELSTAAIVHGSAIALLVQALFGSAYLRRSGVAQRAGQAVIRRQGMTPAEWLTCLANALIWGAEGQGRAPPEVAHGAEVPVFRGVQAEVTGWRWVGEEPRSCWRGVGAPRVVLHARARGERA